MDKITRWRNKGKRKNLLVNLVKPNKIITVFDVETTGLDDNAKIIQFSAVKYKIKGDYTLEELDECDVYINPEMHIPEKITKITNITDMMVGYAKTEKEMAPRILSYLEDSDMYIGYNIHFDIRMCKNLAIRTKNYFENLPYIDVLELTRDWYMSDVVDSHKLSVIATEIYGDNTFQFHSAIEDVRATAMIFEDLCRKYLGFVNDSDDKRYTHLEKAFLFVNPRKKSESRIKLILNEGEAGDVYYDTIKKEWGCCKNTRAIRLFNEINLCDLEEQFLNMYGYRFGNNTVDEVVKTWQSYKKEQKNNAI